MPIVTILPNGGTAYMPSPSPTRPQPKRSTCHGWTRNVARRNADFLLSVEPDQLSGVGYALTLTVRDCPASPSDWQKVRRKFVKRLERMGMTRLHWLTEWQRRGCPHIHAAVWFSSKVKPVDVLRHWIASATEYGPRMISQRCDRLQGEAGWFEYLAKHAARSVRNYQRSPETIPTGWAGKTGRMWGHLGEWPRTESKQIDLPPEVWHQYRRLAIRYQIGKARRQGDFIRLRYLHRYRSRAPAESSGSQALPRLWIPEEDQWTLLRCALASHNPPD